MKKLSKTTMASYGMGKFLAEFLTGAYGAIVFKFYETEIGMASGLVAIATIIYSIWNAVNDPIIGYITNKKFFGKGKHGYRFPWIIAGIILCSIAFCLIFCVPASWNAENHMIGTFIWMVVTVCLYDACYSIWEVNYQGVFPDKFRTDEERNTTALFSTGIGVLGIALGFVVPPLFFKYGVRESYITCGLAIMIIGFISSILLSKGVRETPEMTERYIKREKLNQNVGFFEQMKHALKDKSLVAMVLFLFLYQSGCMCMTSSVHYMAQYVLEVESSGTTIIFAGMLIGALLSIILWKKLSKVLSSQKLLCICVVLMAITAFPMTFFRTKGMFILFMTLWGFGFGGCWTFIAPTMADVVDNMAVSSGRRDDGVIMGIRAFFMRLSYASQAIVFWLCHKLTHFDPDNVTELAKFGMGLHMGAIPAIFFLLAMIVFVIINPLKPSTILDNKRRLKEMNI